MFDPNFGSKSNLEFECFACVLHNSQSAVPESSRIKFHFFHRLRETTEKFIDYQTTNIRIHETGVSVYRLVSKIDSIQSVRELEWKFQFKGVVRCSNKSFMVMMNDDGGAQIEVDEVLCWRFCCNSYNNVYDKIDLKLKEVREKDTVVITYRHSETQCGVSKRVTDKIEDFKIKKTYGLQFNSTSTATTFKDTLLKMKSKSVYHKPMEQESKKRKRDDTRDHNDNETGTKFHDLKISAPITAIPPKISEPIQTTPETSSSSKIAAEIKTIKTISDLEKDNPLIRADVRYFALWHLRDLKQHKKYKNKELVKVKGTGFTESVPGV